MSYQNDRAQQYLAQQIQNASPAEQVVMLYNGAIKFLKQAKHAIQQGDVQARHNANTRASDIITYLWEILDTDSGGEMALRLQRIYSYLITKAIEVDVQNSAAAVDDMIEHLTPLRDAWHELAQSQAVAPKAGGKDQPAQAGEQPPTKRSASA